MTRHFGIQSSRADLGGAIEILLNKGSVALIDADDLSIVGGRYWGICDGYATARIDGKMVRMHRLLMNATRGQFIDHANRNRLDNRRSNLRFCTVSQNSANKLSYQQTLSGYRGVRTEKFFDSFKYRAEFRPEKTKIRGPRRATAEQAAVDYDLMAYEHFGPFAVLNFPVQS